MTNVSRLMLLLALCSARIAAADSPPSPAQGSGAVPAPQVPASPVAPEPAPAAPTPAPAPAPAPIMLEPSGGEEGSVRPQVNGVDGVSEDDDDTRSSDSVTYKPGSGFYLRSKGAQLRLRFIVEPVFRASYLNCGPTITPCPDPQTNATIRRGRAGFKAKLPHDLGLDVEIQVKNLHLGFTHFYGSWSPSKDLEVDVGFIKPPGNIERKVNVWETPWIERGVVSAWVSIARVMGVMVTGTSADRTWFYQAAISKAVPRGLDGAESEDQPPPRAGAIDADDAIKGAGQMNFDGRLEWDPNKDLAVGIFGGVRFRDDGDPGDNVPEPFDTPIAIAHQYIGVMVHGGLDLVVRQPHWRLVAEAAGRRDGEAADLNDDGTRATGNQYGLLGDLTVGYTPNGKYAAANKYAYLKKGWEILTRVNVARIVQPGNEPAGFGGVARFAGVEAGWAYQVHKQLKLQVDASYQWFGSDAFGKNAGSQRVWGEVWAIWKL